MPSGGMGLYGCDEEQMKKMMNEQIQEDGLLPKSQIQINEL